MAVRPAWSEAAGEAAWIGERLSPPGAARVTSVVPAGFEAYARVLHPAEQPGWGERLVRWAEVAAWSGMPLRPDAQFHSVALPPVRPEREAPWSSQGPHQGSLYLPDAYALAGVVREWTATPGECWFCVWDGYGWGGALPAPLSEPGGYLPDPVPAAVLRGCRVHLSGRDYLLYGGPVEAVAAVAPMSGMDQTANLWWPADRSWCVASDVDLPWTYVGGPAGLIERVLGDEHIEALPTGPGDPLTRVEEWVTSWVEQATASLLSDGEAQIATSRGTVRAWLARPTRLRRGGLRTRTMADNGVDGGGRLSLGHLGAEDMRAEISSRLTGEVIGLVSG